ncbi:imidazole glycerol phosphate synthase subunit HisH [Lysobacter koreensis]|uniref:Imidazole glycerol phosphate synthase subunit HisH n=1 Tax=Lysobacter koreensis TaxID=266122 RepID=A0ABW2YLM0_9GAMM
MNVVLVDSGGANIGSVRYALQRLGVEAQLTAHADAIVRADRVILPGVGAAGPGMARLRELGLVDTLRSLQQPLLGICLGMQLLYDSSEEGEVECLRLLPGRVRKLVAGASAVAEPRLLGCENVTAAENPECTAAHHAVRVPHMGWNRLRVCAEEPLLAGIRDGAQAYFVHSYAAPVTADTLASCVHGDPFAAVVRRGRCHGAQFHPERSAAVGARLLQNFLSDAVA